MWIIVCCSGRLGEAGGWGVWLQKVGVVEALVIFFCLGVLLVVGRKRMLVEQGGKGFNVSGNCYLSLKLDQLEKSEVFRGLGFGFIILLIWRKEFMLLVCLVLFLFIFQFRRELGQTGFYQRKVQFCSGLVDRGQFFFQRRGYRVSQVGWGEDGVIVVGVLVVSRCCVSGELGSTFIEVGLVEEILGFMKQGRRSMRKKIQDFWFSDSFQFIVGIYVYI